MTAISLPVNRHPVDQLADIRAKIKALQEQEDTIRTEVSVLMGDGDVLGGDEFVAHQTITERAGFTDLVNDAIAWVQERANPEGKAASGDQGAAQASGTRGAASATGKGCAAMSIGFEGKVMGEDGNALFLVERLFDHASEDHGKILHVWAGIVGQNGIKADTWYTLKDGVPVEVA